MRRYRVTFTAELEVEAENIMQAKYATRRVSAVGYGSGWRGEQHGHGTRYTVKPISEKLSYARARRT